MRINNYENILNINNNLRQNSFDSIKGEEYSNFRFLGIGKPTEKQKEKDKKRKDKREQAKNERGQKKLSGRILNLGAKYSPLALVRAGVLLGIRVNIFGIARKLYPALLSENQLKRRNFNLENAKKAKEALKKVQNFYFRLGGRSASLIEAIKKGYDKPIFRTKKFKNLKAKENLSYSSFDDNEININNKCDEFEIEFSSNFNHYDLDLPIIEEKYFNVTGVDDAATATIITSGLQALGAIAIMIKELVKDNPYNEGTPEFDKTQKDIDSANKEGENDIPNVDNEELKKLEEQAKNDKEGDEKNLAEDNETILGMPKTTFWILISVLGLSILGFSFYAIKKNN
jgi:hypothetical protein